MYFGPTRRPARSLSEPRQRPQSSGASSHRDPRQPVPADSSTAGARRRIDRELTRRLRAPRGPIGPVWRGRPAAAQPLRLGPLRVRLGGELTLREIQPSEGPPQATPWRPPRGACAPAVRAAADKALYPPLPRPPRLRGFALYIRLLMYKPFGNLGRRHCEASSLRSPAPLRTSQPRRTRITHRPPTPGRPLAHPPPDRTPECPATRGPTSYARPGRVRSAHCPVFRHWLRGSLRCATQQGLQVLRLSLLSPAMFCEAAFRTLTKPRGRTLCGLRAGVAGRKRSVFTCKNSEAFDLDVLADGVVQYPKGSSHQADTKRPPPNSLCLWGRPAFLGPLSASGPGRALRALPPRADLLRGSLRCATQRTLGARRSRTYTSQCSIK